MENLIDKLKRIVFALNNGGPFSGDMGDTIEEAIKDVERLDMLEQHGIDWDGLGIYYRGKTISCSSIREGLDKFQKMDKEEK